MDTQTGYTFLALAYGFLITTLYITELQKNAKEETEKKALFVLWVISVVATIANIYPIIKHLFS